MNYNWDEKREYCDFEVLKGAVIQSIEGAKVGSDQIIFNLKDGRKFGLTYYDDCCTHCSVEEIVGDVEDLLRSKILLAECVTSSEVPKDELNRRKKEFEKNRNLYDTFESFQSCRYESETWAFYKISTNKGSVTLRWYGSSNGYYSETATFEQFLGKKNEED